MPFSDQYRRQVSLLVRDLSRLSVDIDLTYVPVESREDSLKAIDAAMKRIAVMLDKASEPSSPVVQDALEKKACELTRLGNDLQIRHTERDREPVSQISHVDYLFHRFFALVSAILIAEGVGWLT